MGNGFAMRTAVENFGGGTCLALSLNCSCQPGASFCYTEFSVVMPYWAQSSPHRMRREEMGFMRLMSWWLAGFLIVSGCSLDEAQTARRIGHWERYPDFRACIGRAVPEHPGYSQQYESCLKLAVVDEEAMKCVQSMTPSRDLAQVEICQRQLRDQIAYGSPKDGAHKPSDAWAGPGIGNILIIIF